MWKLFGFRGSVLGGLEGLNDRNSYNSRRSSRPLQYSGTEALDKFEAESRQFIC